MTWNDAVIQHQLNEAQFTSLMASTLLSRGIASQVRIERDLVIEFTTPDGQVQKADMTALWNVMEPLGPRLRQALIDDQVLAIGRQASRLQTPQAGPGPDNIMPVIKSSAFIEDLRQRTGQDALAARKWVGDLWIAYVFDTDERLELLTSARQAEVSLAPDRIHDHALRNLRRRLWKLDVHENGPIRILSAGGNFETSFLLVDEIWRNAQAKMTAPLVACLPARDVVLFTGANETAALDDLRHAATQLVKNSPYPITDRLYSWTESGWRPF